MIPPNVTVFNNAVSLSQGLCLSVHANATNTCLSDHNLCYVSGPAKVGKWDAVEYAALADWQSGTGQDAHSLDDSPFFVSTNAGSVDLHIRKTSPCVNTAAAAFNGIAAPDRDIDGQRRPKNDGYDIGCDEVDSPRGTLVIGR